MSRERLFWTQFEIAAALGYKVRRVRHMIKDGEFGEDVLRDGNTYLVPCKEFEAWQADRRVFSENSHPAVEEAARQERARLLSK